MAEETRRRRQGELQRGVFKIPLDRPDGLPADEVLERLERLPPPTDLARTQQRRKVTLLDLEKLFDLWVQHYDKVADADKRLLSLKPVYYLAPSE